MEDNNKEKSDSEPRKCTNINFWMTLARSSVLLNPYESALVQTMQETARSAVDFDAYDPGFLVIRPCLTPSRTTNSGS
jgi:hypothetical protein